MNGDAGFERWEIPGEWKSSKCPRKLITQESRDWLQISQTYRAGFLLVGGGILDQPAIYVNAMTLIDTLISKATSK